MNKKRISWFLFLLFLILAFNSFSLVDQALADENRNDTVIWETMVSFNDGVSKAADFVILGEATDANDGPPADSYDAPKSPLPPTPYIYAYFEDGLPYPYDRLTSDFRHYCDGIDKEWDLTVRWDLISYPSTINITWSIADFTSSPYNSIFLRDNGGMILTDMLSVEYYTFTVNDFGSTNFLISGENVSCAEEGENCYDPYDATIDQDVDYEVDHSTIGFRNDYDNTVLGDYDEGEDTIYLLDVITNATVDIILESASSGIAFGLFDECPRVGTLLEQGIDTGSGYASVMGYNFTMGEYYLMVDSNGVSFDYHLSITALDNDAPVAVNDTISVLEDSTVIANISSNDVDVDGSLNLSSITIIDEPDHGSIIVYDNGSIQYTPISNYFGSDLLIYKIKDNLGAVSNNATVDITIIDVNDAPIANYSFEPDNPSTIDAIYFNSTSSDIDGSIVNWSWDLDDGTIIYGEQIIYSYTDNGDYNVELTVQDDDGGIDQKIQTVSVSNLHPTATDDSDSCEEDGLVWTDVLSNDIDVDGSLDVSTLVVVDDPDHGSVSVNISTGEILYIPVSDWFGVDSYVYMVADDDGETDSATVLITVFDVNDVPVAVDDTSSLYEDNDVWIAVLGNDYDIDGSLILSSINVVIPPSDGTFLLNTSTGEIHYIPNTNYFGLDSLTYTVSDDDGSVSNEAIVNVTVLKEDDYPVADFTVESLSVVTYQIVYCNSTSYDPDGTLVNWTWDMDDGTILFGEQITHFYNDDGDYDIELTVEDNEGLTDSIVRTISVSNQPPLADDDSDSCEEDGLVWTDVLSNDIDVDGSLDVSTLVVVDDPDHGSVSVNISTGEILYIPVSDWFGVDSYVYMVADDDGETDSATVLITVFDVNDVPVADFTVEPADASTGELIYFNSTSYDSDGTLVNWTWDMDDGILIYGEEITYQYTSNGVYNVQLIVTDDDGAQASKNTAVTIGNQPPDAIDDVDSCNEDTLTWTNVLDNDYDVDGSLDISSLAVINNPSHGNTQVNTSTGLIQYQPAQNYHGPDSYVYQIADDDGETDTATVLITVFDVNDVPVADFTIEPVDASSGELIYFNSTSTDVDGSIVEWSWDFGDGICTMGEQVTHNYQQIGTFDVILLVTDDDGATDHITKTMIISVSNHPPTVEITQPQEDDTIDGVVIISGTSTDDDGNDEIEYVQIRINDYRWIEVTGTVDWSYSWDTLYYTEGDYTISARSYDGISYSQMDKVNVTILRNNPPYKPRNPQPANESTGVDINVTLQWTGGDPDGDPLSYTVYFGETENPPIVKSNLKTTQYALVNLSELTTYYWKIKSKDDAGYTNMSPLWSFTTLDVNHKPNTPVNVFPDDDQIDVELPVTLQVRVSDPDGDTLIVQFYNAEDHSLIGVDSDVSNNSIAQITWSDCTYDETYHWYAEVSDGEFETVSNTWSFTTRDQEILLEIHVSGGFGCSATIENNGNDDVEEIEWTLSIINTGFFRRPNVTTTDTIEIIPDGYYTTIKSSCFGIGRVRISVTIVVNEETVIDEAYDGFVFGPFLRING